MDLPLAFALVAALAIAIYVVADGFDLGIGILFLLAPRDEDRDTMMHAIAPMWDGNETWLVLGGALLWAAFPIAYYVLLPAFYLPIMTMLFALIFRGIAFEFRFQAGRFRRVWDFAFAGGSLLAALSQGMVLGGFIQGIPVVHGAFAGSAVGFFTLLGLLCGAGLVGGYGLLGAGWLIWKTSGPTQVFGRESAHAALLLTAAMMAVVSAWTALSEPAVAARWFDWPKTLPFVLLPAAAALVSVLIWRSLWGDRDSRPFLLGVALFLLGFAGLAVSLWPFIVPRQATIWDSASDAPTLRFVAVGVAIIVPIILAYLGHAYWVFRGKTPGEAGETESAADSHLGRRCASIDVDLHLS